MITGSPTAIYIYKQMIKKNLHSFASTQKKPHTITKMNDSIHMDSTITDYETPKGTSKFSLFVFTSYFFPRTAYSLLK
jgi:hypothetical protein